ncbi:MAG: TetR/AcrR family transcriptional regulator [Lysobacterales bacterium]
MSRPKPVTRAAQSLRTGRANQKLRTRRLLLATAAALIARGQRPGVAEVADAANVSRRTAWRYFPTRERLLADAALEGLQPVLEATVLATPAWPDAGSAEERVRVAVEAIMRLAFANEGLLRTMIHTTVLESAPDSGKRGARRVQWIEEAIAPLRAQLAPAAWKRLAAALTVGVGIEAVLVLRDILGQTPAQATATCQWLASALVRQSLAESGAPAGRPGKGARTGSRAKR